MVSSVNGALRRVVGSELEDWSSVAQSKAKHLPARRQGACFASVAGLKLAAGDAIFPILPSRLDDDDHNDIITSTTLVAEGLLLLSQNTRIMLALLAYYKILYSPCSKALCYPCHRVYKNAMRLR